MLTNHTNTYYTTMVRTTAVTLTRTEAESVFTDLARRHFDVNAYYWQARIGGFMIRKASAGSPCRLLCIQGTGSGKSVLYQTLSARFTGVTIYITPLLTLGADQVSKLMTRTNTIGASVIPIHLDGYTSTDGVKELVSLLKSSDPYVSAIVFTSPQTLTDKFKGFLGLDKT